MILYYLLPVTSTIICGSYACAGYEFDSYDNSGYTGERRVLFLVADGRVSCRSEIYRITVIYASLMMIVFPLGSIANCFIVPLSHQASHFPNP